MSNQNSAGSQLVKSLLTGVVESVARAGAKAVESLASDARKTLQNQALKAQVLEHGVRAWSNVTLGEIVDLVGGNQEQKKEQGQ